MAETVLKVENLTRDFKPWYSNVARNFNNQNIDSHLDKKTLRAVDDVSFEVKEGEVFGFLGPNGAGKSTTIKIIAGLISATSGDVYICGHNLKKDKLNALSNLGGVIEGPDMYKNMTAMENLEYFGSLQGGISKERINEVLDIVSLTGRENDKVGKYSLGMKQRLGIAQAIMHNPKLLILDEPMNGLDPMGILEIRQLLKKLASNGMTVFTSSHILSEMQQLCNRVAIIDKGKLISVMDISDIGINEKTQTIYVNVDKVEEAKTLVLEKFKDTEIKVNGQQLIIHANNINSANINKELVLAGIMVYEVKVKQKNLEDIFMQATHYINKEDGGSGNE